MYQDGAGEGSSRGNSSNISILLVDDDVTTLHIVSAMLKTWSYEVVTIPNPIDALALLRNGHPFDLVVTDLHMPGMNGLELQKLVHEEFDLPVIMMSSDDKESVILRSLEEGCVYYIVKPVSKEDIQMVWTFVAQSKQRRLSDVTFEDIMNLSLPEGISPGQLMYGIDELYDVDSITLNKGKKKTGKRERNVDDEEDEDARRERRLFAKRKSKVMWGNALHSHFLLAIKHLGFNKAAPKRVLEYMNVPGLTRESVANHLQKYRMYLKRVAEKARLSKCLHEKINRTTLPFGFPTFEDDHQVQYAEYLKQQIYMTELGLLAPPSQDALENLGADSHIGSSNSSQPLAPNQVDNHSQNNNQHCGGSGQSSMLINNPIQNQRAPMKLANGVNMVSQPNQESGFGYQNVMNNGANLMEIDTQQGQQGKQLQKVLKFTSNPFTDGNTSMASPPSNGNMMMTTTPMNNAAFEPSFGGTTGQPTGVFGHNMSDGYNGMAINNDVNDITNMVHNVNLNGATFNGSSSSSRFETGNANQFAPRGYQPMQNSSLLLPPNGMQKNQYGVSSNIGFGNNDVEFDPLMRNSMRSLFKPVSLASVDDDMMVVNNLVMHQLDNNQLPSNQKKGRRDAPVGLSSNEYQDSFLASKATTNAQVHLNPSRASYGLAQKNTPFQLNPIRGAYGLAQPNPYPIANTPFQLNPNPAAYGGFAQPNPNHVANTQAHMNPNPSMNGELHHRLSHMANPFGGAQGNPNYLRANSHQIHLNPPAAQTVHLKLQINPNLNDQVDLDADRFLDNLEFVHAAPNQFGNPNLGYSSASNNNQIGLQMNPNANQGGNPSAFRFENAPNAEQPWIMGVQGGYNPHILNSSEYKE